MDNNRISQRSLLCFVYLLQCFRVESIRTKSIDSLGGKSNKLTIFDIAGSLLNILRSENFGSNQVYISRFDCLREIALVFIKKALK